MKMNEPLLPSFSANSRTYTYESDDVGNKDMSSLVYSSMASKSHFSLSDSMATGATMSSIVSDGVVSSSLSVSPAKRFGSALLPPGG